MVSSLTRRRLMLSSGALAVSTVAMAQPAPSRAKGPIVLLDLDQADVDDAYDVVKASPNLPVVTRRLRVPLVVAVGSLETAWFQRRAREFVTAVQASGRSARLLVVDGYNHFEVIETLANPYGALGRAALEQMKI
jgi:hypothetical protein